MIQPASVCTIGQAAIIKPVGDLLEFWTTMSMMDSRVLSLTSKVSILVDKFGYSSSLLAIIGAFAKTLIPLDADGEGKKTSDAG